MPKSPLQRTLKRLPVALAIVCLALLASEAFLRLTVSSTIEESLWFSGDIHTQDDTFGFRFTPNYVGWMRHIDHVFLQRLTLDEHGFRLPARHENSQQDIVLLGGYSMMFSYGLDDDHAVHKVIERRLSRPSSVYNTAWPGFDLYRSFHIYRQLLEADIQPKFAVILFYDQSLRDFSAIPADLDHFKGDSAQAGGAFRYFPHHAVALPTGSVSLMLGRWYYWSIVLHRLADELDSMADFYHAVLRKVAGGETETAPVQQNPLAAEEERGADRFAALTGYLSQHFGGRDRVLFVFLPRQDQAPRYDRYDREIALLPRGAHYLDLNRSMSDAIQRSGFLAWGHYSVESAALIGGAIAQEINSIQNAAEGAQP